MLPSLAQALEGSRAGDCWTDESGVNHCGDSGSSSDSGYGWQYTYGYTQNTQSSGPSYQERVEAAQLRREMEAQAQIQREAVRLNQIGIDYANKGDWANAVNYYQQANATNPSDPVIANNLRTARGSEWNAAGIVYYTQGDYEKAAEAYQKALELKPESEVIRQNLEEARQRVEIKRQEEAEAQRRREALAAADASIKQKLSGYSAAIQKPAAASSSGLSFKGGAENKSGMVVVGQGTKNDDALSPFAFKNMKPERRVLEAAPSEKGSNPSILDQLKSMWQSDKNAKGASSAERASQGMRTGFDSEALSGGGSVDISGLEVPAVEGVPIVPPEKRTSTITKLEEKRESMREERHALEGRLTAMEKSKNPDPVQIVKIRDEISQKKNEENFLNFSITEEMGKASDVKGAVAKEEPKGTK